MLISRSDPVHVSRTFSLGGKMPGSNIQHPEKLQHPTSKAPKAGSWSQCIFLEMGALHEPLRIWTLGFGDSLDVGCWNLEVLARGKAKAALHLFTQQRINVSTCY